MQPLEPNNPNPSDPQPPYASSPPPPPPPPSPPNPYGGQTPAPYGGQAPYGGPQQQGGPIPGAEKKLPAGLCGILLNGLGVHKFILGYNTEGIIMLVAFFAGFILCGIPSAIVAIVGIVEGIIYLTKSDEQFVQEYIVNKKPWF